MTRLLTFLFALVCFAAVQPASAAVQQVRVVGIGTDKSSAAAEAKALAFAKKRAVYLVARKLPIENPSEKVAALSELQFREIIRGATVLQVKREKTVTYVDATVSIQDAAIKRAFDLPDAEITDFTKAGVRNRGVLLIPVYVDKDRPYVWEKENLLRGPLRTEVMRQSAGTVLIASGDIDDLRLIDYQNALTVSAKEMDPMFTRYGADEIIIAIFAQEHEEKGKPASMLLRRLHKGSSKTEVLRLKGLETAATDEARVKEASSLIASAVSQIASSTAAADRERLEKATKIAIHFNYANPRELAHMQETLREQPGVLLLEIPSISLGAINGVAYYEGDTEKLREKLRKDGIIVTDAGTGWQLSMR